MQKMLLSVAVASVLLHGCTTAPDTAVELTSSVKANAAYIGGSEGNIVRSGSGECLRSVNWSSDSVIVECAASSSNKSVATVALDGKALFDFDSDVLTPAGQQELQALVGKIGADDTVGTVEIVGHADSVGTDVYNQGLSERRAAAVHSYLHSALKGVPMTAKGMGESSPVANNASAEGRRQNRRVEIKIEAEMAQ
jgi:OOP family OmpA-OmpF porin